MPSRNVLVALLAVIAVQVQLSGLLRAAPPMSANRPKAVRLGPGSASEPTPRMVLVRQTAPVPLPPAAAGARDAAGASRPSGMLHAADGASLAELEGRWHGGVVQPLAAARLANAIELTEARVESYRQRLAVLEQYNYYAPPFSQQFSPSWVLPPAAGITPVMTQAPVQLFSPSSTFAHSLDEAQGRLHAAELELNRLHARREARELPEESVVEPSLPGVQSRMEIATADLAAARFELESLDRRAAQVHQLSVLTYSDPFSEFSEEIRLAHLQARLRASELAEELRLLDEHSETAEQIESGRAQLARLQSPPVPPRREAVDLQTKNARVPASLNLE